MNIYNLSRRDLKKLCFVAFANFCAETTPTRADPANRVKPENSELGRDAHHPGQLTPRAWARSTSSSGNYQEPRLPETSEAVKFDPQGKVSSTFCAGRLPCLLLSLLPSLWPFAGLCGVGRSRCWQAKGFFPDYWWVVMTPSIPLPPSLPRILSLTLFLPRPSSPVPPSLSKPLSSFLPPSLPFLSLLAPSTSFFPCPKH